MAVAVRSKLRLLAGFVPEVNSPSTAVPLRHKASYTAVALAVFLVGSQLLVYWTGVHRTPASDPLYWMHGATASNSNTVMAHGVMPLLVSEVLLHLMLKRKIIAPQDRLLLNGAHKLLGILIAFGLTIRDVLNASFATQTGTVDLLLIALQLLFGDVVVIYLDDLLKKGYGLLSGIPLFIAANVCANTFWEFSSPCMRAPCVNHGFFSHQHLSRVVATCVFFLIALAMQGFHVPLPPRSCDQPTLQLNYSIRISYLCFAPLAFQHALVSTLYFIPKLLYTKFGVVNLMGTWKESEYFGQTVPVSGIAYYATTPPSLSDVGRDPVYALLYATLLLVGCAILSTGAFQLCAYSDRYLARLLRTEGVNVTLVRPDSVPHHQRRRYIAKVAFLVGLFVGALTIFASLTGVLGSGAGIMLAVTVIYSCLECRATAAGAFGL